MEFTLESQLRDFICEALAEKVRWGDTIEREIGTGCRADVVTHKYLIEVKPYLTPAVLQGAVRQVLRYKRYAQGRRLVIAGCTPKRYNDELKDLISKVKKKGIEVWLVDRDPHFINHYLLKQTKAKLSSSAAIAALITLGACVVGLIFNPRIDWRSGVNVPELNETRESRYYVRVPPGVEGLNLRSTPTTEDGDKNLIHVLMNGEGVLALYQTEHGWFFVETPEGIKGYVHGAYLRE
jgi:hypothetical protein